MKIKELHLRNIASIEEADIDFERGLRDGVTGDAASIFLISGDTGAGKSVILDGISMALYKNTPRISGVANVRQNEFLDAEGESIRVGSIEQYTRLGISDKDECYSEVLFTGNDGVEYRARLTLGMKLCNTDKATGRRHIKHRTPKWEVKAGSADWTKDSVAETILAAVGLSFEQFGRMAMLAQGQFAAFLTGDKKERVEILEQLTDTRQFADYGKAIKSLFDKSKSALESAQVAFDTESQHTFPQEKVDSLGAEKAGLEKEKDELKKLVEKNGETISLVKAVGSNRSAIDTGMEKKNGLEEVIAGKEYRSAKALVTDWDATSTERQRLDDLKDAKERIVSAKEREKTLKDTLEVLCADLEARRGALKAQGDPQKAVDDKQKEIDSLVEKRRKLEPSKVNAEMQKVTQDMAGLRDLSASEKRLRDDIRDAEVMKKEIAADTEILAGKEKVLADALSAYGAAKAEADETNGRLVTMSAGLDDALTNLRKRLVAEQAETCPLCGQHIAEIPMDEEFRKILTPFEEAQKAAAGRLFAAEKALNEVRSDRDKFSGALKGKGDELAKRESKIETEKRRLDEDASRFGFDAARPLTGQIDVLREAMEKRSGELESLQKQAEELQEQITGAQKDKAPLDDALRRFIDDKRTVEDIDAFRRSVVSRLAVDGSHLPPKPYPCLDIKSEWDRLYKDANSLYAELGTQNGIVKSCEEVLSKYYSESGRTESDLEAIALKAAGLDGARSFIKDVDQSLATTVSAIGTAMDALEESLGKLGISDEKDVPDLQELLSMKVDLAERNDELVGKIRVIEDQLEQNSANVLKLAALKDKLDSARASFDKWNLLNGYFGGTRFRTLVQTYILRPLLNNANIYLEKITDRYRLTCSEDNEQLSILVLDSYNKDQVRSATVLSGGERFMVSLALSLALSSLNRPDMNVNILFIDEGFGTLDEKSLDSVMETLEKLQEIAGQSGRRVGIISHREELNERIPVQIRVRKKGEGRSVVELINQ